MRGFYFILLSCFAFSNNASAVDLSLNIKVNLKGAVDGAGVMRSNLKSLGFIPTNDPYSNGQVLGSTVSNGTGNNIPIDWVLVELRNPANPSSVTYSRAGMLLKSGSIVNSSTGAVLTIAGNVGSYYVAVKHRNHLRIYSDVPKALSATTTVIDFTLGGSYGTGSQQQAFSKWMMIPGDTTSNGVVAYSGSGNDRDAILARIGGTVPTNTVSGYYNEDATMDGVVMYSGSGNDRDLILVSIGGVIPTNTVSEQIPPAVVGDSRLPRNLRVYNAQTTTATLAWDAPLDTTGLTGYSLVINGGTAIAVTGTSYNASGLAAQVSFFTSPSQQPLHNFKVKAVYSASSNFSGILNFRTAYNLTTDGSGDIDSSVVKSIQVSAKAESNPKRITLYWVGSQNVTIYRKLKSATSWGSALTTVTNTQYADSDASLLIGESYEYKLVNGNRRGFLSAGIQVPLPVYRGKILVLVKSNLLGTSYPSVIDSTKIDNELEDLKKDLQGDGWFPVVFSINNSQTVGNVKGTILAQYGADPNVKSVLLIGHIPVPYSGDLDPDGHPDHQGAWPADNYYADMNGTWTDSTVNRIQADSRTTNVPGDGKFDQSYPPSAMELQIGRVDFSSLPAFSSSEIALTEQYLTRLKEFKRRTFVPQFQGIVKDALIWVADDPSCPSGGCALASSGFRSISANLGPHNIFRASSYYDGNQLQSTNLNGGQTYLWSWMGGGADAPAPNHYTSSAAGYSTSLLAANQNGGIFNMILGSFFGDWDTSNNLSRAMIASGKALVNVWAGLPNWYFQHMAIGETVGYSGRMTMSNTAPSSLIYDNYNEGWANGSIHQSILGDPSLRQLYVDPVSGATVSSSPNAKLQFNWTQPSNVDLGYRIYEITNGIYTEITTNYVTGSAFEATSISYSSSVGKRYMIKAFKMEDGASGSYINQSVGAIIQN